MKANNHRYYEMLISRYKDNDLNSDEIKDMEDHLSICKSCRKFRDEIDSMSLILTQKKNIVLKEFKKSKINKKILYIASIAAVLLVFIHIFYNKNDTKIVKNIDNMEITEEYYMPLSEYLSYFEKEDSTDENQIMSAYMFYVNLE